jgi:cysteine desulfurase
LRDRFVDGVLDQVEGARETVPRSIRHPGNAHLGFAGTVNEEFLFLLDAHGVAASAGSACASGALEPSHVLIAMGMSAQEARSCIRFSLGASTTEEEIEVAIARVAAAHRELSARSAG